MIHLKHLPHQLPGEKVVKIIRRDVFVLIKKILFFLLLVFLPMILLYFVFTSIFPDVLAGEISGPLLILGISAYYLFIWLFFFFSFIDYYLDVWLITNERIIDIQQRGFFSRTISEQRLFRVQDVTSEVHGILPTIFKYGNVHIQTAGARQRFFFHEVPQPEQIRNLVIKLSERSRKIHGVKE